MTELHRAGEAERERREHQAFLLTLSDALRLEPSADAIANRALRLLSEQMQLDGCYITSYRLEDDRAHVAHQWGNDRVPPLPEVFRVSDYPSALRATSDQTLVIEDALEPQGLSEVEKRAIQDLGCKRLSRQRCGRARAVRSGG